MSDANIDYSDKHNPVLRINIDGYIYSFSVGAVSKSSHQWLCEVLQKQMNEIHKRACDNTKKQIQKDLCASLGLEHILRR